MITGRPPSTLSPDSGRLSSPDAPSIASLLTLAAPPAAPTPLLGPRRFACSLPSVLSAAEAASLIAATEALGYTPALLNMGGGREALRPDVRDSTRCIVDSPALADALFARLRHALPPLLHGLRLLGMNERLRFLRYGPGQQFRAHRDGPFARGAAVTLVTVLLYLNEGYEGFTTFYPDEGVEGVPPGGLEVVPTPGLALLLDHALLHAAPPLRSGVKYVMRSDIFYG